MVESTDPTDVLGDISILYELSLSIGASLDARTCCDAFLRTLMARKNLDFASVWIRDRLLTDDPPGDGLTLVYANPAFRVVEFAVPAGHALSGDLGEEGVVAVTSAQPEFARWATEKGLSSGRYAIFRLGDVGVLKLHSARRDVPFDAKTLNQLRQVTAKFAIALEGCLAHGRAMREIERRRLAEAEREKAEQRVRHALKLESLGVLAGGIADDFNNLLTGILGHAGLARAHVAAESPARRAIENVEKAALRAADLCRQLLAYAGKGNFTMEPLDLSATIRDMVDLLEASLAKNVRATYDLAEGLPIVNADATRIRQIVMSLVANASEAMGVKGGDIRVQTSVAHFDAPYLADTIGSPLARGRHVFLEVRDTGIGMDEETRARIFEPFFTTKLTGRGLGLAAVLGIVRGHQGAVRIESAPDRGASLRVLFPVPGAASSSTTLERVAERAQSSPGSAPARTASADHGLVLVADDEADVREVAEEMLRHLGYDVVTAADGLEAIERVERLADIRLVLLDLSMPRLSGEETFTELRRRRPHLAIVVTSGHDEEETMLRFAGRGLNGFLRKPFRLEHVEVKVREALQAAGAQAS